METHRRLGRRSLLVVLVASTCILAGSPSASADRPLPRVTMITDSVGGALYWDTYAQSVLAYGLDLRVETKTCRRLVETGCPAYGERPPSALETIQSLGHELGPVVVIDVGYNDHAEGYADGLDTVMRALVAAGVQHVVWVTLEETQDVWVDIDAQIRAAPERWPQLVVADWAPVSAGKPWFVDLVHMNAAGALAFARFLRPIVLGACGPQCTPPTPPDEPPGDPPSWYHELVGKHAPLPKQIRRRQRATAAAASLFSNVSSPFSASTITVSPAANSPSSRRLASGFSTSRWIARLSGRAP